MLSVLNTRSCPNAPEHIWPWLGTVTQELFCLWPAPTSWPLVCQLKQQQTTVRKFTLKLKYPETMSPNKTEEGSGDETLLGQRVVDVSQVAFQRKTLSLSGVENCSSEKSQVRVQPPVWTLSLPSPSLLLLPEEKLPLADYTNVGFQSQVVSWRNNGQKAVKQALVKGLGLNPNLAPTVALYWFTN